MTIFKVGEQAKHESGKQIDLEDKGCSLPRNVSDGADNMA
jgi:hypothetical protein